MKRKTPKAKLQAFSKPQGSPLGGVTQGLPRNGTYPELQSGGWVLNDGTSGESPGRHPFDLHERTARFGEAIIRFFQIGVSLKLEVCSLKLKFV